MSALTRHRGPLRPLLLSVTALLAGGCAGMARDVQAAAREDEADLDPIQVRCASPPIAGDALLAVPLVVVAPQGVQPVGELYDRSRRGQDEPESSGPKRHALVVDADVFARTVEADLARLVAPEPGGAGPGAGPWLVVEIVDVSTTTRDPGWTALRWRVASRVVLRAEIRGADGEAVWADTFEGEREERPFLYRLTYHERTLSGAYCAALARAGDAAPRMARALAARAAGGAHEPEPEAQR